MIIRGFVFAAFVVCGACISDDGSAVVEADFLRGVCPERGELGEARGIRFEAGWLGTERYYDALLIQIFYHQVRLEETNGLSIRLPLGALLKQGALVNDEVREKIVRADLSRPLSLSLSNAADGANAILQMYEDCPDRPAFNALQGMLLLDDVEIALDGLDTGNDEHLSGTLTATLSQAHTDLPEGSVRCSFDFKPPRQPLADFR